MIKYFLAFLIFTPLATKSQDLIKYYNGELDLSKDEILQLSDSIITADTDSYLTSLAHFQKSVLHQNEDLNFEAFEALSLALKNLLEADTTDHFLHSAILRNQGYILKQHWMIAGAIEKYNQALEPAFAYSTKRGLSVKYNLARALAFKDEEEAVKQFLEILEIAKKEALNYRIAKVYNELGLILVRAGKYEGAQNYFEEALDYAEGKEVLALTYQNYAHMLYESKRYHEQRQWLMKSLSLGQHKNRFVSLMDLGENYLIEEDYTQARKYLLEAELLYDERPLKSEHVKVFKWLAIANLNADEQLKYERKRGDELEKIVSIQQKLENKLKQQAMLHLVSKIYSEDEANKKIGLYQILTIAVGILAISILLTWRIWWYRLRRKLGRKIISLVGKWDV